MFEHSLMKRVSRRIVDPKIFQFRGEDPIAVENLRLVGASFAQLQDSRHLADYDVTLNWTKADALDEVRTAALAFEAWHAIRHTKIAQDYLVSLLIKPRE